MSHEKLPRSSRHYREEPVGARSQWVGLEVKSWADNDPENGI
jgi:hypothetical protein